MANENVQAIRAANRDVPAEAPKAKQECSDVIHISIFFDGTGNNEDVDKEKRKWSNVSRLYQAARLAAQADKSGTLYPIYIAGVGTKFNDRAADRFAAVSAWVEDGMPGAGAGAGGSRRMEHARDRVNERLRDILIANAKSLGGDFAKYATKNSEKSFHELSAALSKHRLIKVINLSIFGFSRGAALARAFSNRVLRACKNDGRILLYEGYPLRLNFIGVFDTVASFGVPAQNARTPFSERELIVSSLVERCVHYVAAHELRFSFPVDLIRKDGRLAGNWVEKVYPGVHSDVGGGYEPIEQQIDNNFARIPMRDMMGEALANGVRMLSYNEIKKNVFPLFTERFHCREDTENLFNAYMSALAGSGGTVEEQIKCHLKLYYSANGAMHRKGVQNAGERSRGANKVKYIFGSKGMAFEVRLYRSLLRAGERLRLSERSTRGLAQYIEIKDWQLIAWDADPSPSVVNFVARYVHDSKVDFLGNIEPFTYFRPRGVEESSVSVWTEGGNWIRTKVHNAASAASAGKEKLVNVAEEAAARAEVGAEVAQKKAIEASEFARRKASEASLAANRAYDATARSTKEAADEASRRAQEAADYARRRANDVAEAATKACEAAATSTGQVVTGARKKVDELESDTQKIYENGVRWTFRTVDEMRDLWD